MAFVLCCPRILPAAQIYSFVVIMNEMYFVSIGKYEKNKKNGVFDFFFNVTTKFPSNSLDRTYLLLYKET
jgi:hypothetical protein